LNSAEPNASGRAQHDNGNDGSNDGGDMRVALRATFGILLAAGLAIHGASAAGEAEVPWQGVAANLKAHKIVANVDQDSFARATARYPLTQSNGNYPIRTGRYLMWKIVGLFTSDQHVELLRLASFVMSCRTSKAMVDTEVICDLNAAVLVRNGGRTRVIDISSNRNVGRFFDPAKPDYAPVIYAEIRDPLDRAILQVQAELKAAGIL
jgi:hypothetical protein